VTRLPDHDPDDRVPLEEVEISVKAGWNLKWTVVWIKMQKVDLENIR